MTESWTGSYSHPAPALFCATGMGGRGTTGAWADAHADAMHKRTGKAAASLRRIRAIAPHLSWKRGRPPLHTNVNLDGIVGESTKNRFGARIIGIVTAANRTDPAIWSALAACDIAELRADGFPAADIPRVARELKQECLRRLGRPLEILVTLRLQRDGGAWPDTEAAMRVPVWQRLDLHGPDPACDWIDVEVEVFAAMSTHLQADLASGSTHLLLSHHELRKSLSVPELRAMLETMKAGRPAGMKFALTCASQGELMELLRFAREVAAATPNGCVLSMGPTGSVSRVLAPLLGCPLTYGYLSGGAVAPGQLPAAALARFYLGLERNPVGEKIDSRLLDWAEARILKTHPESGLNEGEMLAD
jgi:3-dehydroquinate dehydratase I